MINKFREIALFDNLMVNQLCDEMATIMIHEGSDEFPNTFLLSGAAAYALQVEYPNPIQNIVFRVVEEEMYYKLLDYLDQLSLPELTKYANRTYFKFPAGAFDVCFMLMFGDDYVGEITEYNGIYLEPYVNINPELL